MKKYMWMLGASDPEMAAIENLLLALDQSVVYARAQSGDRVWPGQAYSAADPGYEVYAAVECRYDGMPATTHRIDHHAPGDTGYGVPPAQFFAGSSIGQVYRQLVLGGLSENWVLPRDCPHTTLYTSGEVRSQSGIPGVPGEIRYTEDGWSICSAKDCWYFIGDDDVLAAAADHCLAAAYRGECPGVDPDALMAWRVKTRAAFQKRDPAALLADVDSARTLLRQAMESGSSRAGPVVLDRIMLGGEPVIQITGKIPELPEASARENIAFISSGLPDRDGRVKTVLQSATPSMLEAWPEYAAEHGLTDLYGGDPARGFAGGYVK